MNYQRNRLVIGGIIGAFGCLILLGTSHPILGFIALFLGFISSIRAIFNGAPIIGILLTKANGFLLILFPIFWAASVKFLEEEEQGENINSQIQVSAQKIPMTSRAPGSPTSIEEVETRQDLEKFQPAMLPRKIKAPSPPSEKETAHNLILTARLQEQGDDLDLVMNQYAEKVRYFGREVSKNDIRVDKAKYWGKWPVRKETIDSDLSFKVLQAGTIEVTFQSSFRNENPTTGAWISGDLRNRYLLGRNEGELSVTDQSCEVSNIKKEDGIKPAEKFIKLACFNRRIIDIPETLPDRIVFGERSRHPKAYILGVEAANIVRLTLLAEAKRDIDETMSRYAAEVRYFESDKVNQSIRADKENYFKKWPGTKDTLISNYHVTVSPKPEISVIFTTKFSTTNAEGSIERTGEIDHTFIIAVRRNELLIIEQNGKVRNLKTIKKPQ